MVCVCPEYRRARQELLSSLPPTHGLDTYQALVQLFSGSPQSSLPACGKFLARTRQARRRLKLQFESLSRQMESRSFACKRIAWRIKRKYCCRHGVLFEHMPDGGCKCMIGSDVSEDWVLARFMPALDENLKTIVAVPFERQSFVRLGLCKGRQAPLAGSPQYLMCLSLVSLVCGFLFLDAWIPLVITLV